MSVFEQIAGADVSRTNPYVLPGLYLCEIRALKIIENRKKQEIFVAELSIKESNNDQRPVGTTMSWLPNLTTQDGAPGNVLDLLSTLAGVSPKEVSGDDVKLAVSKTNPFEGTLVGVEAYNKPKRNGDPWTAVNWTHVAEEASD